MAPEKANRQIKYQLTSGKDGVYAKGYSLINERKKRIELNRVFTQDNKNKILNHIYRFDRDALLLQAGLFCKNLITDLVPFCIDFRSDDRVFLIKAFEHYDIGYMDEPLFYYRLRASNTHKNYWLTFPMRIDIATRLMPDPCRIKTISNIMFSQGKYLPEDKKIFKALSFFLSSLILHFSLIELRGMIRSNALFLRDILSNSQSKNYLS